MNNSERIVVFGGTGFIGKQIVQKFLNNGNLVTVVTRKKKKSSDKLTIINGDVRDAQSLNNTIQKNDQIVIALSLDKRDNKTMSIGTANIIKQMNKAGAVRLVCISGQGVGESIKEMPFLFRFIVRIFGRLQRLIQDHARQEELIKNTELEWTIIRPTRVINKPETKIIKINPASHRKILPITVFDVAQVVVSAIEGHTYIRKTITITG